MHWINMIFPYTCRDPKLAIAENKNLENIRKVWWLTEYCFKEIIDQGITFFIIDKIISEKQYFKIRGEKIRVVLGC